MKTTEDTKRQLLIIGNGFDLYCKLASGFTDYLKSIYPNYIEDFSNFPKLINHYYVKLAESKSNFHMPAPLIPEIQIFAEHELILTLFFVSNVDIEYWNDFEGALSKLVLTENNNSKDNRSVWEKAYTSFYNKINIDHSLPFSAIELIGKLCYIIDYKRNTFVKNIHEWNKKLVLLINDFEQKFAKYLKQKYDEKINVIKGEYENRKDFILKKIIGNDTKLPLNVLSFNYTSPNFDIGYAPFLEIEHVHGKLINLSNMYNIIIGIDSTNLATEMFGYELSKTYRKAAAFVRTKNKEVFNVIDKGTTVIKFFGHSLNEQDYSYFQSIFDTLDLYNSQVRLEFFFSIYDEQKDIEIRNEEVKRIVTLIETYGRSLGNKDQGKNLLHKLLLQDRFKIIEIPYEN